jgi:prophage tail gpP-like protein
MALSLAAVRIALDNDAIQLVINGTSYQGWTDIDMDSDIVSPADAFCISGTLPKVTPTPVEARAGAAPKAFDDFREGNSCDIYVGLDRQMAGVIDRVDMTGDRNTTRLQISGRDRVALLLDNEAKHVKAAKYTLKSLIEALIDPSWGIRSIIDSNDENRRLLFGKSDKKKPRSTSTALSKSLVRARTKVDPGQRVASIIDIHCKRLGITWWLTAGGDLFIGKPNYDQEAAYSFTAPALGNSTPSNVLSWSVARSASERYSEIKVVGQGFNDLSDAWKIVANPLAAATFKVHSGLYTATARDPDLVERGIVRKMILSDSDIVSFAEAQNRANVDQGERQLRGTVINLTVPGFRQGDRLYTVDTIATVKIEEADIDGTYYVLQRRFTENRGKRRTQLTLVPPKVWLA